MVDLVISGMVDLVISGMVDLVMSGTRPRLLEPGS